MTDDLFPTPPEVERWITDTVRHAWHIEYYLERLQVGATDVQRPHDLMGLGNKLEWRCIRGFAMQYRGAAYFESFVLPSLHHHRKQHHHAAWNQYSPNSSVDAMKLGAVDACCSMLEPRAYQGGCHDWDGIEKAALANPIHKAAWMLLMAQEMAKIEKPEIELVTMHALPAEGISRETRELIVERIQETKAMLWQDQRIKIGAGP